MLRHEELKAILYL